MKKTKTDRIIGIILFTFVLIFFTALNIAIWGGIIFAIIGTALTLSGNCNIDWMCDYFNFLK